jgi:hypothetical protein
MTRLRRLIGRVLCWADRHDWTDLANVFGDSVNPDVVDVCRRCHQWRWP